MKDLDFLLTIAVSLAAELSFLSVAIGCVLVSRLIASEFDLEYSPC